MKHLFSSLFCMIGIFLQAQDTTLTDTTKWKKNHIGITYSTDYNYRLLEADSKSTWIKDIADSMEAPKYGFSTGINYALKLNKKSSLSTGILFSNYGEKTKSNVNLQTVNYTNHYYFVSIPVRYDYTILSKKIDIYTSIGITGNFFIHQKTSMYVDGKKDPVQFNNRTALATWNIGGVAGLGMHAKLSNNWFFKLEVLYKRSITAVNNDPVKKWFYAVGPNFGLFYSF
jgi:hypothetical protein